MKSLWTKIKNKTGQLGNLQSLVISLIVIGFVLVIGLTLMGDLKDEQTVNTSEYNASVEVVDAIAEIPGWLGIIVLSIVGVVILGIVQLFRRQAA